MRSSPPTRCGRSLRTSCGRLRRHPTRDSSSSGAGIWLALSQTLARRPMRAFATPRRRRSLCDR
jgi:hypothetical protein